MSKVTFSAQNPLSGVITITSNETDCVLGAIVDFTFLGGLEPGQDRYLFEGEPESLVTVQELMEISTKLLALNMDWLNSVAQG